MSDHLPALLPGNTDVAKAIEAALARMDVRKRFLGRVKETGLQAGVDYGLIPGCGDKPALLKGGAEAIALSVTVEAESLFTGCGRFSAARVSAVVRDFGSDRFPKGCFFYEVEIDLVGPSGRVLATGVGSASTQERKYREGRPTKPGVPPDQRWAADSANTVFKMAVKRAKVDAAVTLIGGSTMFTQDIDDGSSVESATDSKDPLDRDIGFGKYAGQTWREAASDGKPTQRDCGASWQTWLAATSHDEHARRLAQQALEEAAEIRGICDVAPTTKMAAVLGADLPALAIERPPAAMVAQAAPALATAPPPDAAAVLAVKRSVLRNTTEFQARAVGITPAMPEWGLFVNWARKQLEGIAGGPLDFDPTSATCLPLATVEKLVAHAATFGRRWQPVTV